MRLIYHPASLGHDTGDHPETAARLRAVVAALEAHDVPEASLKRPEPVSLDLLAQVHDPRYIATVERLAAKGGALWGYDTVIMPDSYEVALLGAGAAQAAAMSALDGTPAFALVRPPGHHALYDEAMGFCLFNNVVVAAQACIQQGIERVLIVDWDVHHGNGTQDYFYTRSDVLFFSTHQYPFYPGTGALGETGAGEGRGYTLNVPLPAGVGDEGYLQVFREMLEPAARRYRPEVILVSAGYDSHRADPLGGMGVTVGGFYRMAEMVRRLAGEIEECRGRVALVLEGGYNTEALALSVLATIAAMEGEGETEARDPAPLWPLSDRRSPNLGSLIAQIKQLHDL
jgi:acetoin utilization deacetylase AcuC-like enzyme